MKYVRDRSVSWAAGGTALVVALLFGNGWFSVWLLDRVGYLAVPGAVGAPATVPGLRLWPLGDVDGYATVAETIAAIAMVAVTTGWVAATLRRRPAAAPGRLLLSGWCGLTAGIVAGQVIRVVAASFVQHSYPGAYAGQLAGAVLFGLLWGVVLGWAPGLAALLVARRGTVAEPA